MKPNEYLNNTCKFGQGENTCKYLYLTGMGFQCQKTLPSMKKIIDSGKMKVNELGKGDNCSGLTIQESYTKLNSEK